MSDVLEVLKRARARLAVPEQWTNAGADALNASGSPVNVKAPTATRWCAWGAVMAEAEDYTPAINALCITLIRIGPPPRLAAFNDAQKTVEPVLRLFDDTIARLESGAAP